MTKSQELSLRVQYDMVVTQLYDALSRAYSNAPRMDLLLINADAYAKQAEAFLADYRKHAYTVE